MTKSSKTYNHANTANTALFEMLCGLVELNTVHLEYNEWWHVAYTTNLFPSIFL